MSAPLIAMCPSVPSHWLPDALLHRMMLRKLCLLLFNLANPPHCWCGKWHDPYGGHIFQCVANDKKMPHNFICDGQVQHMQPLLVTAGYIRAGAKLRRETPDFISSNKDLRSFNGSFSIDPSPETEAAATCLFAEVGWDTTIVRPPLDCPVPDPANVIPTVTANADLHLQRYEWGELMRLGTKDGVTGEKDAILIHFAIDHLGRPGPMARHFLFGEEPALDLTFPAMRPNAAL
ncbi:hypothetical protein ACHAWF_003451, partial [Thalassiosira exigua]